MARALPADLPEVTDAHRRAAFEAMHWSGWTFEAAMGNDTRRRLIEARAHQLRTRQWQDSRTRTERLVPAYDPRRDCWRTRHTRGDWAPAEPDLFNLPTP